MPRQPKKTSSIIPLTFYGLKMRWERLRMHPKYRSRTNADIPWSKEWETEHDKIRGVEKAFWKALKIRRM